MIQQRAFLINLISDIHILLLRVDPSPDKYITVLQKGGWNFPKTNVTSVNSYM